MFLSFLIIKFELFTNFIYYVEKEIHYRVMSNEENSTLK